jgi:hypothetical protein
VAVASKTYSFRAPGKLSERMREARAAMPKVFSSSGKSDYFTRAFPVAVQQQLSGPSESSGQIVRAIVEAFVSTVERVQSKP